MQCKFVMRCLICIFLIACFQANADTPDQTALNMVKTLQLGSNLAAFSKRAAFRTQTYASMVKNSGSDKAEKIMKEELLRLLPKYQEQWDKNLAQSYLEHFTPTELESLARKQKNSPYINKLQSEQAKVGASMQKKSNSVLVKFVTEAVKTAFQRASEAK